jgi:hypothetical protein
MVNTVALLSLEHDTDALDSSKELMSSRVRRRLTYRPPISCCFARSKNRFLIAAQHLMTGSCSFNSAETRARLLLILSICA